MKYAVYTKWYHKNGISSAEEMSDGMRNNVKPGHPADDIIWWKIDEYHHQSVIIYPSEEEAKKRGVNDNRIIIASFMPNDEHLKRITLADIFLDTFPYNAHTTASDAVRMGVPIITLTGNSFHSRVGASILKTINMEDLITYKKKDYEDLAIELGSKPEKLTKYKNQLREAVVKSPLFDSVLFTKNLEELYLKLLNN